MYLAWKVSVSGMENFCPWDGKLSFLRIESLFPFDEKFSVKPQRPKDAEKLSKPFICNNLPLLNDYGFHVSV